MADKLDTQRTRVQVDSFSSRELLTALKFWQLFTFYILYIVYIYYIYILWIRCWVGASLSHDINFIHSFLFGAVWQVSLVNSQPQTRMGQEERTRTRWCNKKAMECWVWVDLLSIEKYLLSVSSLSLSLSLPVTSNNFSFYDETTFCSNHY